MTTAYVYAAPISTTHVITSSVLGVGATRKLSAVRWGVAGNIALAWALTLPAAAVIGAATYGLTRIFGTGALGPVLVSLLAISLIAAVFARRAQRGSPVPAT
jgi:PiT family inorganic phosphate transporter